MKKTTIYYSVSNGGDGSAYPNFFFDKDCADLHQEIVNEGEGWGEDCVGSLTITHTGTIEIDNCMTREEYIKNFQNDLKHYVGDSEYSKKKRQKCHIALSKLGADK